MVLADWSPGSVVRLKDRWDLRGRLIERRIGEFTSSEPMRRGFEFSNHSVYYAEVRWQDGKTQAYALRNLVLIARN